MCAITKMSSSCIAILSLIKISSARKFLQNCALDLFALFVAIKNGFRIKEIEVNFSKRIHDEARGTGLWKTESKLISRTFYIFKLKNSLLHK